MTHLNESISGVYADPTHASMNVEKSHSKQYHSIHEIINNSNLSDRQHMPESAKVSLRKLQQDHLKLWSDLQVKLSKLNLNEELKASLASHLDSTIEKIRTANKNFNVMQNYDYQLNFLDLKLYDAVSIFSMIKIVAGETSGFIDEMLKLATSAADGSHSSDELIKMNEQFQSNKSFLINNIQRVYLINGYKTVAGGDITIQIGEDKNDLSTLIIEIPAFDPASLSIIDLSIDTQAAAVNASNVLHNSSSIMRKVFAATESFAIVDAKRMLDNIPFVLYQDWMLLIQLDILSTFSTMDMSDDDRINMDMYFSDLRSMLVKIQTYASPSGPKMLGGGTIHIQVGKYAAPENILDITLPVIDIKKLGMDNLNLRTVKDAERTSDALRNIEHDFVYSAN